MANKVSLKTRKTCIKSCVEYSTVWDRNIDDIQSGEKKD